MATTKILASNDIAHIIRMVGLNALMDELIMRFEAACRGFDTDSYNVPVRSGFHYSHPVTGLIEWMPAMQRGRNATIKLVSYHPSNPTTERLPTILSSILVFNTRNGHLNGIVDGTFITALRTGAASAVASKTLARPDCATLGLIGCGAQAVSQLHALTRSFPLREVLLYDIDTDALSSFPERIACLDMDRADTSVVKLDELVRRSDIICTCTSIEIGEGPAFADTEVREHLHVNAVGSDFPGKTEIPRSLLARSLVCPDFQAQAIVEGECQQLREDEIGPDLIELVKNSPDYAHYRDRLTVFDSTGWAIEDHVAGEMIIEYAEQIGIGESIELESISADPKDPYGFAMKDINLVPSKRAAAD